ncbi:MAG: hypothetical protein RLZZ624_241 [Cyanobacteriota bacterium]|jgi:predicted RND superfamily exporter protein
MDDVLETTLEALAGQPDSLGMTKAMAFLLIAGLGLAMALIYIPLRVFLTATARSRRLRLLQRIRRLREELGQPVAPETQPRG